MKIGWGWKITILYGSFVLFMSAMVIASNRQHFDLVSNDYYEDEIAYQKVIEASKNQCALLHPMAVHANKEFVTVDFPDELKQRDLAGNVQFYSPVNATWDRTFKIKPENNVLNIPRNLLHNTRYIIKIKCAANGKNYYQESEIILHT